MKPHTSIAALRLRLPDGTLLRNQRLLLSADGHLLHHEPLLREEAFTRWHRGEIQLQADHTLRWL